MKTRVITTCFPCNLSPHPKFRVKLLCKGKIERFSIACLMDFNWWNLFVPFKKCFKKVESVLAIIFIYIWIGCILGWNPCHPYLDAKFFDNGTSYVNMTYSLTKSSPRETWTKKRLIILLIKYIESHTCNIWNGLYHDNWKKTNFYCLSWS